MGALANAKHEWNRFRHDPAGERFCNHRWRTRNRPLHHSMIAVVVGALALGIGFVLLFMPGPGLLLIAFGLALVASHSDWLAKLLDRGELTLRGLAHRQKQHWKSLPGRGKLGVLLGIAAGASAGLLAWWHFLVSAYLIG